MTGSSEESATAEESLRDSAGRHSLREGHKKPACFARNDRSGVRVIVGKGVGRRRMDSMNGKKQRGCRAIWVPLLMLFAAGSLGGQAPTGPLPPKPGVAIQQPPKNEIKVQVALVTTPVTVRDLRGEMVHDLEAKDFRVTDNGAAQKISHFDLGGDPISLLILSEAVDHGSEKNLGGVLRQVQLANVTIYSVGLSTTRAELQAKPKAPERPNLPVGSIPPPPGVPATPTYEDNYGYGSADLMAAVVWLVQHIHGQVNGNPLEVAAAATGGASLSTFRDRSIENDIDEIGGELHSQYTLSYMPTDGDAAGYHEIKVSLLRNDAKSLKIRA